MIQRTTADHFPGFILEREVSRKLVALGFAVFRDVGVDFDVTVFGVRFRVDQDRRSADKGYLLLVQNVSSGVFGLDKNGVDVRVLEGLDHRQIGRPRSGSNGTVGLHNRPRPTFLSHCQPVFRPFQLSKIRRLQTYRQLQLIGSLLGVVHRPLEFELRIMRLAQRGHRQGRTAFTKFHHAIPGWVCLCVWDRPSVRPTCPVATLVRPSLDEVQANLPYCRRIDVDSRQRDGDLHDLPIARRPESGQPLRAALFARCRDGRSGSVGTGDEVA